MSTEPDSKPVPSVNDLKLMAYKGLEMPAGLASSAQTFYIKARALYKANLPEAQGKREMAELAKVYETDKQTEKLCYEISQLWKRIEEPARIYSHSPTIENADKFYAAVYGLPDDWRLKRYLDKERPRTEVEITEVT